jgi:acyl-CoA thioesterase FadM
MQTEGFVTAVQQYRIEYRQPGVLGDELEIATWISDVKESTAASHYTITRTSDDTLLAQAHSLWETVDAETGHSVPIPAAFLNHLTPYVADDPTQC